MDIEYYKNTGINQESDFIDKLYGSVTGIETVGGTSKKVKKTKGRKKTRRRKKTMGGDLCRGSNSRKGNRHKKTTRRHKKTNYELYKNLILNYKKGLSNIRQ